MKGGGFLRACAALCLLFLFAAVASAQSNVPAVNESPTPSPDFRSLGPLFAGRVAHLADPASLKNSVLQKVSILHSIRNATHTGELARTMFKGIGVRDPPTPATYQVKPQGALDCVSGYAASFSTIQDAVNVSGVPGDVIRVCAGTYPGNVFISQSGLTLVANNNTHDATVEGVVDLNCAGPYNYTCLYPSQPSGVVNDNISGLVVTTAFSPPPGPEGPMSSTGIELDSDSEGNRISDNWLIDNSVGITIGDSPNNTFANNTVNNSLFDPSVGLYAGGLFGIWIWDIADAFSNDTFENNTVAFNYYGIYLEGSSNNTFKNSTVYFSPIGINLEPDVFISNGNTFRNDTVDAADLGVQLASASNTLLDSLAVNDTYCSGIDVHGAGVGELPCEETHFAQPGGNNTVVNNNISMSTEFQTVGPGIRVNGSATRVEDNNVSVRNAFPSYGPGIRIDGGSDVWVASNTVVASQDIGLTGTGGSVNLTVVGNNASFSLGGIRIQGSQNVAIFANNASFNDVDGIDVQGSQNVTLSNNTASFNNRSGSGGDGILVADSPFSNLANNTANNNTNGVHLLWSPNGSLVNNTVLGNTLSDAGGAGILLESSDSGNVTGNVASLNYNGIQLNFSDRGIVRFNNASNNTGNRVQDGSNNIGDGIFLFESNNSVNISGNTARDNNAYGIHAKGSSGNQLDTILNILTFNALGGFLDEPASPSSHNVWGVVSRHNGVFGGLFVSSDDATIQHSLFEQNPVGLSLRSATVRVVDSAIVNSTLRDLEVNDSNATLVNTTFDPAKVAFSGTGELTVSWLLGVSVVDGQGNPVANATVVAVDSQGRVAFSAATDASGRIPPQAVVQFVQNSTAKVFKTPHTVFAERGNLTGLANVTVDGNKNVTVVMFPDTTPPVTTAQLSGTPGRQGYFVTNVTVTLSATDVDSLVAQTQFSFDNVTFLPYTGPFVIAQEGNVAVYYRSVDPAGNIEATRSQTIKIDKTPPTTAVNLTGTPGNASWFLSDVRVTLAAADATSGVSLTQFQLDNGTLTNYAGPFNVTGDGVHTVAFFSTDVAGNVEATKTQTVKIDETPPSATINLTGTPGNAGWFRSDVQVAFNAFDSTSGVATTQFQVDNGTLTNYTGPFTLTQDGVHTAAFFSTDVAGNSEPAKTQTVKIDKTPPSTAINLAGTSGNAGWFISDVRVTLAATDTASGVAYTRYQVDNGTLANYTGPFNVTGEGVHIAQFFSADIAGNVEATKSQTVKIDRTPPTTSINLTGTPGNAGWFRSDVQVSLSAADPVSGVALVQFQLDDGAVTNYTSPFTIAQDGAHTVQFFSTDIAGNVESVKSQTVKLDKTPPITAASLAGTAGSAGWFLGGVQVTLAATDATSGVSLTQFQVDNGALSSYAGPFNVTGDGAHTVTFFSTDVAGNVEAANSAAVQIDALAPEITILSPANGSEYPSNASITVLFAAQDNTSGVANVSATLDGVPVLNGSVLQLSTLAVGLHTLSVSATDVAGNAAVANSTFRVKQAGVNVTVDIDPDSLNLQSRGRWVTAYIETPGAAQIDLTSIRFDGVVSVDDFWLKQPLQLGDYNFNGIPDLMVKFDRQAVQTILQPGENVTVWVSGLVAGQPFNGSDTLRVFSNDWAERTFLEKQAKARGLPPPARGGGGGGPPPAPPGLEKHDGVPPGLEKKGGVPPGQASNQSGGNGNSGLEGVPGQSSQGGNGAGNSPGPAPSPNASPTPEPTPAPAPGPQGGGSPPGAGNGQGSNPGGDSGVGSGSGHGKGA